MTRLENDPLKWGRFRKEHGTDIVVKAELTAGIKAVLWRENQANGKLSETEIDALASFAMISAQGL